MGVNIKMAKKKQIFDKAKSEQKSLFHTPTAKPTVWHKDKSKYNRTKKYKVSYAD
jgi:hypothetical protein